MSTIDRPVPLADDLVLAVREYKHDYAIRHGQRPELLVLAGARVWEKLVIAVHKGEHPWWRLDSLDKAIVGADGNRVIRADLPINEWRLAVLAEWRGSVSD